MGSDRSRISQTWLALVNSGNIRYLALPAAEVPIADDAAWDQLFAAAGAPIVPYWLCGFAFNFASGSVVAEHTQAVDIGWGGADGVAIAPANVIVTDFPITVSAVALALGPFGPFNVMLPYAVRIPAGSRMAARIASSIVGGVAFTSFRVILATAIGS